MILHHTLHAPVYSCSASRARRSPGSDLFVGLRAPCTHLTILSTQRLLQRTPVYRHNLRRHCKTPRKTPSFKASNAPPKTLVDHWY